MYHFLRKWTHHWLYFKTDLSILFSLCAINRLITIWKKGQRKLQRRRKLSDWEQEEDRLKAARRTST